MSDKEQEKQPERTEEQTEKTAGERVVELNDKFIRHEKAEDTMVLENPDSTPPPPPKEDTSDKK